MQVTTGCSGNKCNFCGAYLGKSFRIKDIKEIFDDIERGSITSKDRKRVFLLDGDALVIKNDVLIPILERLADSFPKLSRVSSYANGYNITKRSDNELKNLFLHKLTLIYMGLESGSQYILDKCGKVSRVEEMEEAVARTSKIGIKSSVIVILGLGGKKYSDIHVRDTIAALNRMQPRYLSFLSLMPVHGTGLYNEIKKGDFEELDSKGFLRESYEIIKGLHLNKTIFRANHASNYLPLEGRFPQDKEKLLDVLDMGLREEIMLKPEFLRIL